jgi:hypothetical protein
MKPNGDTMMNGELQSLMRDVGRAVEGAAQRQNILPRVQAGLAARQLRPARSAAVRWSFALGGLAACAAAALIVLRPRPISYAVAGANGEIGAALVAPAASPLDVRFSDGSAVTIPPRAAAHVDALDRDGATVAIEAGTLEVSVIHRAHTRWQVRAGDYRIQVTGTRFAAGWDRASHALTVTMHEGSVLVTGPGLEEPVRVVTGQRLRASASGADLGLENEPAAAAAPPVDRAPAVAGPEVAPPPTLAPPSAEIAPPAERGPAPHARRVEPVAAHAAPPPSGADWRAEAARAQYREALAAAVLEGWRAECSRLGADDLVLLGDVARLAGDLDRAEEAYRSARRRFPESDRPTFALGLIAFEGRHNYKQAGDLFASYLRSFPRGPLAREAAGRLIESRLKAGDDAQARQAAATYLHDFPGGPHAALAKRTVGP